MKAVSSLFDSVPAADPCAGKHGGNPQSVDAFERGKRRHGNAREQIVEIIYGAGPRGMTREEIATAMGKHTSEISGRVTELLSESPARVRETGATRETQSGRSAAVLVHMSHLGGRLLGTPSAIRERM